MIRDRVRRLPRPLPVMRECRVGVFLRGSLERLRRPLVQFPAPRAEQRRVRDLLHEPVRERARGCAHVHQSLIAELEQRGVEVPARHQRLRQLEIDRAPHNGERRRDVLDQRRQSIEPGQDEALERRRDDRGAVSWAERTNSRRYRGTPSDTPEDRLLAFRGKGPTRRARGGAGARPRPSTGRARARSVRGPRIALRATCSTRVLLHGPQRRDDEDSFAPRDLAKSAKRVERARVAPVQILQAQHDRPGAAAWCRERRDCRQRVEARGLRRRPGSSESGRRRPDDGGSLRPRAPAKQRTRQHERGRGCLRTACSPPTHRTAPGSTRRSRARREGEPRRADGSSRSLLHRPRRPSRRCPSRGRRSHR